MLSVFPDYNIVVDQRGFSCVLGYCYYNVTIIPSVTYALCINFIYNSMIIKFYNAVNSLILFKLYNSRRLENNIYVKKT